MKKNFNEFSSGAVACFQMPNYRPNLWWAWLRRCSEKSNTNKELPKSSVEMAKAERANCLLVTEYKCDLHV